MSQKKSNPVKCPKCKKDGGLIRIKRTLLHRLISMTIATRRYKCYYCGWRGLIRKHKLSRVERTVS